MSTDPFSAPLRHPQAGPRWRVAVVRAGSAQTRRRADDVISQLRVAGCMAVEIDTTASDPFVDVHSQWSPAVAADAYDLVLSIERLLPAAVAIAALAGVPVATITKPPTTPVPAAIEAAVTAGKVRSLPVLEVVADRSRRVTMNVVDAHTEPGNDVVAQLGPGRHPRPLPGTAWSISPIPGPAGQLLVTEHDTNTIHQADQVHLRAPHHGIHVEIDGRARTTSHLDIRGIPQGLRILHLDTGH